MSADKEVELIGKLVDLIEASKVEQEFDLPRVLDYIMDRYDFGTLCGRKRTIERIIFQLNKVDKQGLEESV